MNFKPDYILGVFDTLIFFYDFLKHFFYILYKLIRCVILTHKRPHVCILSTVDNGALVLKHQAISIHSTDKIFLVLYQLYAKISHLLWITSENKITFRKKQDK